MAILVNMPRLSDTMEEGVVAKWLKQVGDKIEEGDILAEIETDKATMEFESFNEGTFIAYWCSRRRNISSRCAFSHYW